MATSKDPEARRNGAQQPPHVQEPTSPQDYWGSMFRHDNCPTTKLDHLLRGIAACIAEEIDPSDSKDLTPDQLAHFYHQVGGDYSPLFKDMPHQSIAFIYRTLGCLHSLQPDPNSNALSAPTVPALKAQGFVRWQSIQLLLGPEEHVPFIQRALKRFRIKDPDTGNDFPRVIPSHCFPADPDPDMCAWHAKINQKLRQDALQSPSLDQPPEMTRPGSSDTVASDVTAEERADAAKFFARPALTRNLRKAQMGVKQGSQMVLNTAKNMANPLHLWNANDRGSSNDRTKRSKERPSSHDRGRRKSLPDRTFSSDRFAPDDPNGRRRVSHSRTQDASPSRPFYGARSQASPNHRSSHRRMRSIESLDSEDEEQRYQARNNPRQNMRRHNSYEPPASPKEHSEASYISRYPGNRSNSRSKSMYEDTQLPPPRSRHSSGHRDSLSVPNEDVRYGQSTRHSSGSRRNSLNHPASDTRDPVNRRSHSQYRDQDFDQPRDRRRQQVSDSDDSDSAHQSHRVVRFSPVVTPAAAAGAVEMLNPSHSRNRSQTGPGGPTSRFNDYTISSLPASTSLPKQGDYFSHPSPSHKRQPISRTNSNNASPRAPPSQGTTTPSRRDPLFEHRFENLPPSAIWHGTSSINKMHQPQASHFDDNNSSMPRSRSKPRGEFSNASPRVQALEKRAAAASELVRATDMTVEDDEETGSYIPVHSSAAAVATKPSTSKALIPSTTTSRDGKATGEDDDSEWWNESDEDNRATASSTVSGSATGSKASSVRGGQINQSAGPAAGATGAGAGAGATSAQGMPATASGSASASAPRRAPPRSDEPRDPRPSMVKQVSAVAGVGGRAYPKEYTWK